MHIVHGNQINGTKSMKNAFFVVDITSNQKTPIISAMDMPTQSQILI